MKIFRPEVYCIYDGMGVGGGNTVISHILLIRNNLTQRKKIQIPVFKQFIIPVFTFIFLYHSNLHAKHAWWLTVSVNLAGLRCSTVC